MEEWKRLEFMYAEQLRRSDAATRRQLYGPAYSEVAKFRPFRSSNPEDRTAGTSKEMIDMLLQVVNAREPVLEIGCGRGYTCMMLAPHVQSIVGTDVSSSGLLEARALLQQRGITNGSIEDVSAIDLREHFGPDRFGTAVSIEVVEHLHPEDAEEHMRQVFDVLKPGGEYVIVLPNRLTGPHDITRQEYPDVRTALGFHLNESTYGEMVRMMRKIGYRGFASFVRWHKESGGRQRVARLPYQPFALVETLYGALIKAGVHPEMLGRRINTIRLIARKPA